MSIQKLGEALRPEIGVAEQLFASTDNYLASIIVSSVDANNPGEATVYITPFGSSNQDNWAYILHEIKINPNNSLETHRFAIDPGDQVYVSSNTGNVAFVMTGIRQTTYKSSLPQTFYNKTISGELNTINNLPNSSLINSEITLMDSQMNLGDNVNQLDYFQFNTFASVSPLPGRMWWNSEEGTVDLEFESNVTYQMGMQLYMPPTKNNSGQVIPAGAFVMSTGAQGDRITIAKAVTNGSVGSEYMIGVAAEEIQIGSEFGKIITQGTVYNINTSQWPVGTILYPSPTVPGGFTSTKPDAPNIKTPIAIVLRQNANNGRILVRMERSSELGGTDTNVLISSPTDGQFLVYDSSTSLWKNESLQIYPDQSGNQDKFLRTNGTSVYWESVPSVLPSQDDNAGKYLTTNGTTPSWTTIDFSTYATLNSPTFTGTVTLPANIVYTNRNISIDNSTVTDLLVGRRYFANTLSGEVSTRLPASANIGDEIEIFDATNNASNNNIIVSPNGLKVEGSIQDFIIDMSATNARLVYTGSNYGWMVAE